MKPNLNYLISENGSYINLKMGAVVSTRRPDSIAIKSTNRLLLFTLCQHANEYVPVSTLLTIMYPDKAFPLDPVHQLENRISKLRHIIDDYIVPITNYPVNYILKGENGYAFFPNDALYFSAELPDSNVGAKADADKAEFQRQKEKIDKLADEGVIASKNADHEKALRIRKEVYKWRKKNLSEDNPELLTAISNLALTYSKLLEHKKALELRLYIYKIRAACLEPDSEEMLRAAANLAVSFSKTGQDEAALKLRREVYEYRLAKNATADKIRKSRKELAISLRAVGGEENRREASELDAMNQDSEE